MHLMDLPLDLSSSICDEKLTAKHRAILSVCSKGLRQLHQVKCARHASFQQTRSVMSALIYTRYARQNFMNQFVFAYVINTNFLVQFYYDIDDDVHAHKVFTPLTVIRKVPPRKNSSTWIDMTCRPGQASVHFSWGEARCYLHPNSHPTHQISNATYMIPETAWNLYVCECQPRRQECCPSHSFFAKAPLSVTSCSSVGGGY